MPKKGNPFSLHVRSQIVAHAAALLSVSDAVDSQQTQLAVDPRPLLSSDPLVVAGGEAIEAEVEVGTGGAADAGDAGQVGAAVVALVESPGFFAQEDQGAVWKGGGFGPGGIEIRGVCDFLG
mmetsp:Transcript_24690/g.47853  ORF Transcript_24690/g.47853 Transcript_24690/m.47853 type:complete len:122 (+) Transcript_24690:1335-1700(+)